MFVGNDVVNKQNRRGRETKFWTFLNRLLCINKWFAGEAVEPFIFLVVLMRFIGSYNGFDSDEIE